MRVPGGHELRGGVGGCQETCSVEWGEQLCVGASPRVGSGVGGAEVWMCRIVDGRGSGAPVVMLSIAGAVHVRV